MHNTVGDKLSVTAAHLQCIIAGFFSISNLHFARDFRSRIHHSFALRIWAREHFNLVRTFVEHQWLR